MKNMKKTWEEIILLIRDISRDIFNNISSAAVQSDIDKLKNYVDQELPDCFIAYMMTLNGQKKNEPPLIGNSTFLSIDEIIEDCKKMNSLFENEEELDWIKEDKIKPVIWSSCWVTLASCNSTTRIILDLSPGINGTYGQIFLYQPGMDYNEVIASSFEEFSFDILKRLKQNEYIYIDSKIQFNDLYL